MASSAAKKAETTVNSSQNYVKRITLFGGSLGPESRHGKKLVFATGGQLFAASAHAGGDGLRVTHTTAKEYDAAWAPDSRRIAYVSDRDGETALFLYDFATNAERRLTPAENAYAPQFSPDGKELAYLRDARDVRVIDLASHGTRTLVHGAVEKTFRSAARKSWCSRPTAAALRLS